MADEHLMSLQPGTVIAGRYEVVKCLGAGSMGLVYACRHRELPGHLVAVKVLFPEVANDKVSAARFRNEIFASYNVSHPNVVRAYEYLRDGDLVAYTMEYVGGGALVDKLGSGPSRMSISEIVRILSQMCSGVQAIHDAGIVHRDLKPENILLTKDGQVKIADFGIARTGNGPRLTEHGGVVGTIDYVSPEYMLNAQVDWRSDIYALGILAYEMVTGDSPFKGDSVYATMTKRLKTDPVPPSSLRPECPEILDTIILRAMNRDPEQRYQSAAEMLFDLQKLMPDEVAASGAYMQINRMKSSSYVGPVLESGNAAASAQQVPVEMPISPRVNIPDEEPPQRSRVVASESAPAYSSQRPGAASRAVLEDLASSSDVHVRRKTFTPAVEEGASAMGRAERIERATIDERSPQSYPSSTRKSPPITIGPSAIDDNRLRKLSQLADEGVPSVWADIVIFVVAAVIGILAGFLVLNYVSPGVLRKVTTMDLTPSEAISGATIWALSEGSVKVVDIA